MGHDTHHTRHTPHTTPTTTRHVKWRLRKCNGTVLDVEIQPTADGRGHDTTSTGDQNQNKSSERASDLVGSSSLVDVERTNEPTFFREQSGTEHLPIQDLIANPTDVQEIHPGMAGYGYSLRACLLRKPNQLTN